MMELGITSEDILLLGGEAGCGKSVVLRSFISALDSNSYLPVYLRGTPMNQTDLLKTILAELKEELPNIS
jgi:ABC-type dipeptide/oligopeptide/nickel transport system ATPase component